MDTDIDEKPEFENKTRVIINNVLEKCKIEKECNELQVPINDYEGRAAYYTGLPKHILCKVQQAPTNYLLDSQAFDVFERMLVLQSLLRFYISKHSPYPTVGNIFDSIKESLKVRDIAHFYQKLTQMGFDYRKTTTGQILAEDMKFTFERYHYLKKINKCKTDKLVMYYIDERVMDESLSFLKPDFNKTSDSEDTIHLYNGYYFYHVLSDKGLENYLFTNKKCKDTYIQWVSNILLKVLKPGSIIVIDDHPLHGELIDETITRYHSQSDMINWLKKNNIPCSVKMHKAELYELIRKCNKPNADYNFDKLLKSHGFDVIRLPFGCKNMSPASLLWKEMDEKYISLGIDDYTPIELEEKIIPAISSLHKSSWKKLQDRIAYWEEQFHDIDSKTEAALNSICKFDVYNIANYY